MATRDSTNDALAEQRAIISRLFDDIKRRDEQAYAMVSAIKSWLPNDLQPDDSGQKYTTQHLLDLLEDLLENHTLFYEMKKHIAAIGEVQA